ncbi:trypsin-like serine protease [Paractinoplanes rishiriensis]|uniref:trypsin-like serine protease n=1 Tax=Paractinoplanes rishiriensis TaxID=1050105 RepID=UPI001944B53F|nr:trypsin-like serine protease [Actinoplanes rishiriensis]
MRPGRRFGSRQLVTGLLVAAACIVVPAAPANAVAYNYYAGHPANPLPATCTGGYAVAGASGVFVVTAGHCATNAGGAGVTGRRISGTDEQFGTVIRNDWIGDFYTTNSFDGALIRLDPDDTAYQIVEDPITHTRPGNGRVRGWYANSALYAGMRIGKMGITTGWREGTITEWRDVVYPNGWRFYTLCSTADSRPGDSGGPVWRNDGNGLMAIGISIGGNWGTACFIPIQNVLNRFGATLPVFTSLAAGARPNLDVDAARVVTERSGPPIPYNPEPLVLDSW